MSDDNSEVVALLRELVGLFKEDLELSKKTVEWTKQRPERASSASKFQQYYALAAIAVLCVTAFMFIYFR